MSVSANYKKPSVFSFDHATTYNNTEIHTYIHISIYIHIYIHISKYKRHLRAQRVGAFHLCTYIYTYVYTYI